MSSKGGNKLKAKHCVGFYEQHTENALEVLDEFIEWTHKEHLKNYIVIGKMLDVSPNKANRLLHREVLPEDKHIVKKMKEVMSRGVS